MLRRCSGAELIPQRPRIARCGMPNNQFNIEAICKRASWAMRRRVLTR
ncbi:hypothetical protein PLANPX_3474 [Lacipirellula parvula]|uniref:Uncharacterized protein n=1 Tax=Lacipirellula parvula TaxID=2650471 RepID=A0A5K7XD14_9BACT|nr:hypothetical protein PLANPX_3474 [Lacipirellula parvula]